MTDKEKIQSLQKSLHLQLEWFKKSDDDYAYDEAHNEFGREECYTILKILSEE